MNTNLRIVLLVAFSVISTLPQAASDLPWQNWQEGTVGNHKFIGKIWSAKENDFVTPAQLIEALATQEYVLLGEVHDNRDHHRLQAWIIKNLTEHEPRKIASVVMEMIRADKVDSLAAFMNEPTANSTELAAILDWENSGWPLWDYYQPIADVIFAYGLALYAGDATRERVRKVARKGFDVLSAQEQLRIGVTDKLPEKLGSALDEEIIKAHCHLLPLLMIAPMVKVQRLRDGTLAGAMIAALDNNGDDNSLVILIAGNGHVRRDRAVPWVLAKLDISATSASLMQIEVEISDDDVEELMPRAPDGKLAADFFWFTPKVEREDQCEKLRQRFKKN